MCEVMSAPLTTVDEWTENMTKGCFNPTDRTTEVSRYNKCQELAAQVQDCENGPERFLNKCTFLTLRTSNTNNFRF